MKRLVSALCAVILCLLIALPVFSVDDKTERYTAPDGYNEHDYQKCVAFLELRGENGLTNGRKLSDAYDPNQPETWGYYWDDFDSDGEEEQHWYFTWVETEEGLRLKRVELPARNLSGELDLADCAALKYISSFSNMITALDASGCTALKKVVCTDGILSNVDVSGDGELILLDVFRNNIKQLDVSTNINLCVLSCSENYLTELDLSNNGYLDYDLIRAEGSGVIDYEYYRFPWGDGSGESDDLSFVHGESDRTVPPPNYLGARPHDGYSFVGWYDGYGQLVTTIEWLTLFEPNLHPVMIARFSDWQQVSGDIDDDGEATISDALLALRASMGLLELSPQQISVGDVNRDGVVDVTDALMILRFAMGLIVL